MGAAAAGIKHFISTRGEGLCWGSNFSSSADEPQIPHGEILIPFFQCSVQKPSQLLGHNPPVF